MTDTPPDVVDWNIEPTVEALNAVSTGTIHDRMGIVFTEVSPERVVATMPVEGNTQPYGLLHGGASVVLAESVGSMLAVVVAGPGKATVGVDINATHHRPARSGLVTAVATALHVGRSTGSFDIVVTDDQGHRVCTCRLTAQMRDAPPGQRYDAPPAGRG